MDYGPIAHHGTCLDNQFSTSEIATMNSKTFRKGPTSQERWGEDDGSAPPEHWQDWCIWLLGIWLCLSPWILPFGLDPTATQATVISGLSIIVAEVVTLSAFRAWEEWISVILGIG